MGDSLIVKLGAETSEFIGQLAKAGKAVQEWGGEAGGKLGEEFSRAFHRKLGVSDVSRAALVSLGIDAKEIADRVARAWTGVSKEEEEAYKKIGDLSAQVADAEIEAARKKLDAQQKLQLLLLDEQRTKDAIASNQGKTAEQQLKQLEDRQRLLKIEEQLVKATADAEEQRYHLAAEHNKDLEVIQKAKEKWAEEDAQRAKKATEDDVAWYKKHVQQEQELRNLKIAALEPEDRLKVLQSDQYALQQKITKEKHEGVDTLEDEIKAANLDKDVQQAILEILQKQANVVKEKTATMNASGDLGVLKISSGFQTYNDPEEQAQYEKGLVGQAKTEIQYQIDELQGKINAYLASGSALGKYELPGLQDRLKALQGRSQHVQDFVFNPNYSDAAGKGIFANQVSTIGDPLGLQKKQTDTLGDVNKGIDDLNNRLRSAGFGINSV